MEVTGAFNALIRPGLRTNFRDSYNAFETEWDKIVKSGTMDRPEIEMVTLSGLPRQYPLGESEPYIVFDAKMGDVIRKTDSEYGMAFSVSQNMMENDQYGKANQSSKWLGRSVKLTQEHSVGTFLDDSFTGTYNTGFFAEKLISSTHALLGSSSTWSNQISGNPQLGVLGLQAAFEMAESQVDQMGEPIPIKIDTLIVKLKDQWNATQLTENNDEPFTTDRNINALKRKRQLSFMISHYAVQTDRNWWARDTQLSDAHLDSMVSPTFVDWFEDRIRTAFFGARQRFALYFGDQRGWIGSAAS